MQIEVHKKGLLEGSWMKARIRDKQLFAGFNHNINVEEEDRQSNKYKSVH